MVQWNRSRLKYRTFLSFQSLTLNAHPINTIYDLQARSLEFNAYFTTITIEKQSKARCSSYNRENKSIYSLRVAGREHKLFWFKFSLPIKFSIYLHFWYSLVKLDIFQRFDVNLLLNNFMWQTKMNMLLLSYRTNYGCTHALE